MDSYSTDRRYTARRSNPHRRHNSIPQQGGLRRLLVFQALVSIILFLIIIIANSINISAASFIIGQVRYVLDHNVELKSIYAFAQTTASDIRNSIIPGLSEDREPDLAAEAEDFMNKEDAALNVSETDRTEQANTISQTELTDQTDPINQANPTTNNDAVLDEAQLAGLSPETSVLAASSGDMNAYTSGQPGALGMISPMIGPIATPFGEITGPGGIVRMHKGIDVSVEHTSDVKAVLDGIVAESGSAPGYGNFIRLSHDNGLTTVYGNCSSIAVKKNDPVKKGNIIAGVGEDSMTGGGHLHFEVWNGNDPVDPLEYIVITAG